MNTWPRPRRYALTTDVTQNGVTFQRGMEGDVEETWTRGCIAIRINIAKGIKNAHYPVYKIARLVPGQYVEVTK